jgi:hypothetical protein
MIKLPKPSATIHDDGFWTHERNSDPLNRDTPGQRKARTLVYTEDQVKQIVKQVLDITADAVVYKFDFCGDEIIVSDYIRNLKDTI